MLNWISNPNLLISGIILASLQCLAALPWLWAIDPKAFRQGWRTPSTIGGAVLLVLGVGIAFATYLGYKGESPALRFDGKVYGAILHMQLLVSFFILAPQILLLIAPKAGAVALAAYREGWRQPMFWLITGFSIFLMAISIVFPYFTFGDDYKMMKQIGFDIIMLAAVLFGVLAASISISEEIEGRTAITVMSKPINRRNFLFGKFLGILMACAAMSLVLGWFLNWALLINPEYDKINEVTDALATQAQDDLVPYMTKIVFGPVAKLFASGAATWFADTVAHSCGILLGFGQVMILVAVASAMATRLSFVANVLLCLVIYFLGHLAPVVVKVSQSIRAEEAAVGVGLVQFLGQLFDTILPALEFFNMGPAIIRETPLDLWSFAIYVLTVFVYSCIYTAIALLVGLLLFEDRDLA